MPSQNGYRSLDISISPSTGTLPVGGVERVEWRVLSGGSVPSGSVKQKTLYI